MTEQQTIRISFRDALIFVLRGLPAALILATAAAAVVYVLSRNPEPIYRSTAILLATRPSSGFASVPSIIAPSQVDPAIYRSAIVQGNLISQALNRMLGRAPSAQEVETWRERIRVRVDENLVSGLVHIEVEAESPESAATMANALVDALLTWDRTRVGRNIQATLSSLDRSIVLLGAQIRAAEEADDQTTLITLEAARDQLIEELRSAEALNLSAVVLGLLEPFRDAAPDPEPVNDRAAFLTAASFAVVFILTYVALVVLRLTDPRVRAADDVIRTTGAEPLAVIPGRNAFAPEFQLAISRVALSLRSVPRGPVGQGLENPTGPGLVLVTSPTAVGAKHALSTSLAEAYARGGWRTLLVLADPTSLSDRVLPSLRNASMSMMDLAQGSPILRPTVVKLNTGVTLEVVQITHDTLPTSSLGPLAQRLASSLLEWKHDFEVIILDTPALSQANFSLALSEVTDNVILAVLRNQTPHLVLQNTHQDLVRAGFRGVGTVLFLEKRPIRRDESASSPIPSRDASRRPEPREAREPGARVVSAQPRKR